MDDAGRVVRSVEAKRHEGGGELAAAGTSDCLVAVRAPEHSVVLREVHQVVGASGADSLDVHTESGQAVLLRQSVGLRHKHGHVKGALGTVWDVRVSDVGSRKRVDVLKEFEAGAESSKVVLSVNSLEEKSTQEDLLGVIVVDIEELNENSADSAVNLKV